MNSGHKKIFPVMRLTRLPKYRWCITLQVTRDRDCHFLWKTSFKLEINTWSSHWSMLFKCSIVPPLAFTVHSDWFLLLLYFCGIDKCCFWGRSTHAPWFILISVRHFCHFRDAMLMGYQCITIVNVWWSSTSKNRLPTKFVCRKI